MHFIILDKHSHNIKYKFMITNDIEKKFTTSFYSNLMHRNWNFKFELSENKKLTVPFIIENSKLGSIPKIKFFQNGR